MEADSRKSWMIGLVMLAIVVASAMTSQAANFRTQNFLVQAPDDALARAVGQAAEKFRHDLAVYWLGRPLPPWPAPCPIRVIAGANLAAQGVTTYNPRPVSDFQMEVVGTPERILDSVLPHEVTHTVLASHFGRPLPRWADEGICTTVEHESERNKHEAKLREFLRTRRGIAMNQLFLMTEYPNDVLPMYAQGYSVCQFFIAQKDPQTFIAFLEDYMRYPSWTANVRKHYGYDSLAELQQYWLEWVSSGSGSVEGFVKTRAGSPNPAAVAQANVTQSNIAQANFDSPPASAAITPPRPANRGPNASLAQVSPASRSESGGQSESGGWYQRKRLEAQAADPRLAAAPTKVNAMVPPSVRNSGRYQSAQPQPEMGVSRRPPIDEDSWPTGGAWLFQVDEVNDDLINPLNDDEPIRGGWPTQPRLLR